MLQTITAFIAFSGLLVLIESLGIFLIQKGLKGWPGKGSKSPDVVKKKLSQSIKIILGAGFLVFSLFFISKVFGFIGFLIHLGLIDLLNRFIKMQNRTLDIQEKADAEDLVIHLTGESWLRQKLRLLPLGPWISRLLVALPDFFLAAMFASVMFKFKFIITTENWLSLVMKIQFLVIHSFPFVFFLTIRKAGTKKGRIVQWYLFGYFLSLYVYAASMEGLAGLVAFFSCTFATYMGFLLQLTKEQAMIQSFARWFISLFVFMIFAAIAGVPESVNSWHNYDETIKFGFLYFAAQGIIELSGIIDKLPKKIKNKTIKQIR